MIEPGRPRWTLRLGLLSLVATGIVPGCALVPRDRLDESQRLAQSLRTENARLKDQVLTLQTQNRDYADRALDDLRRLTARDEAIERLEQSVQGYQDDRDRLADAYRRLAVSLGRTSDDSTVAPTSLGRESDPIPSKPGRTDHEGGRDAESVTDTDDADTPGPSPRPSSGGSSP